VADCRLTSVHVGSPNGSPACSLDGGSESVHRIRQPGRERGPMALRQMLADGERAEPGPGWSRVHELLADSLIINALIPGAPDSLATALRALPRVRSPGAYVAPSAPNRRIKRRAARPHRAFYLRRCHTRAHGKHTLHRDTADARPTSRPTASQARPARSVTVSDGGCRGRTRAERRYGLRRPSGVALWEASLTD
jgi:hypothetical protein